MDDVVDLVRRSLADETDAEFTARVDEQAAVLREAIAAGRFDNEDFAVGLEVEVYAIHEKPEPVEDDPEDGDAIAEAATDEADEADADGADLDADLSSSASAALDPSLEPADPVPDPGAADAGAVDGDESADDDALDEEPDDVDEPYMDPEEWEGKLAALPESVFEGPAAKELGVHNAEINTDPDAFGATGLEVQTTSVEMRVKKARDAALAENRDMVLDAMWTIPPEGGTLDYFTDVEQRDGVVFAENMRQYPRYVALDNEALAHAGGEISFSVPGAEHAFPSILFESLTTSIQPHLQVPTAGEFPDYYNAAIRTLGPVLALTANSPLLPADLYNRVDDPYELLDETHHELRIAAFEQSVNTSENPKVRVPRDIETSEDVVDRVVADDCFAPFLREWITDEPRQGVHDEHWEFDHKRGTYWRWLRCVVGGDPVDGAGDQESLRIEYRPIPTQPTVEDLIGTQVLVAGLVRGLVATGHPLAELPWQDARRSFYDAARNGLDAELAWVTEDGERTTDHDVIYDEIFSLARAGLDAQDVPERRADEFLDPLERRWTAGETPSSWKIGRVREHLDDGHSLEDAICEMQRDYFELSQGEDSFADWLSS
ncbi:hypothetical protein OB920_13980 [Halobacteria archaeon HArc-gm2]|nr:hypothetical protein [Halobacteria archaeon HArc-gm2]